MAGNKGSMVEIDAKMRLAAKVFWAGEGTISVTQAMGLAKYTADEIKNRSLQQRVRRAVDKVIPRHLEETGGERDGNKGAGKWRKKIGLYCGSYKRGLRR